MYKKGKYEKEKDDVFLRSNQVWGNDMIFAAMYILKFKFTECASHTR